MAAIQPLLHLQGQVIASIRRIRDEVKEIAKEGTDHAKVVQLKVFAQMLELQYNQYVELYRRIIAACDEEDYEAHDEAYLDFESLHNEASVLVESRLIVATSDVVRHHQPAQSCAQSCAQSTDATLKQTVDELDPTVVQSPVPVRESSKQLCTIIESAIPAASREIGKTLAVSEPYLEELPPEEPSCEVKFIESAIPTTNREIGTPVPVSEPYLEESQPEKLLCEDQVVEAKLDVDLATEAQAEVDACEDETVKLKPEAVPADGVKQKLEANRSLGSNVIKCILEPAVRVPKLSVAKPVEDRTPNPSLLDPVLKSANEIPMSAEAFPVPKPGEPPPEDASRDPAIEAKPGCVCRALVTASLLSNDIRLSKVSKLDVVLNVCKRVLETAYHGLIKENETFVEITPLIKVDETKICGFHIIKKNKEIPFQIELVNELGILKAKKSLNCEKRKNYRFDITAVFCDGSHSKSANVHISVIDINEYSPTFLQPSYVTEVDEGRLYQEIIRVEATDKDCTPLFGDVCKYEILTSDQPFTIDNEGSIRNTEPLSHKASHNHILSVVAYDCAMKQSAPVMVNIRVRRVCEAHVMGVAERIDYIANSMESVSLFPKIHLELCDMQCKGEDMVIQSSVSLKTKHISFGCDRDASQCLKNLSEEEQIESGLIDLLQKNTEWTKDLMYDEGSESIFHFDGSTGAVIPKNVVKSQDFAAHQFSMMTMFRHHSIASNDKHTKEHIICSADDHKMNRHHMALFVRNCRLILLLRKNFNDGDLNIFSPAEWRWKIPQVCDNEWHHYTINVDLPKIDLYVDGVKFESNVEDRHSNPEVIDDWPLHAAHGINTTLAIGACYQGSENRLKHGFSGDISEIKLSLKKVLTPNQIRCGTDCAEKLLPPPDHFLEPEQQIQSNTQMNKIIIEGSNKSNIEQLLQQIQYINSKENPTIGRRNIQVMTTVSCPNKKAIRLPTIDTYIMVTSSNVSSPPATASATLYSKILVDKPLTVDQKPQIEITGNSNHLVSYPDIKDGVKILAQINISIYTGKEIRPALQKLDSCQVIVFPSLNPDHEEITIDDKDGTDESLFKFDIKTKISKDGVEMIGYDTIENYQHILKSLVYINKKPAYYLNRVFKLTCAQVDDRFRNAEYTLTLTVLHPKQQPTSAATSSNVLMAVPSVIPTSASDGLIHSSAAVAADSHDTNQYAHAMLHSHDIQESQSKVHNLAHEKAQLASSHSTMLIVVICASFVLLICGVGIARLRNNSSGSSASQAQNLDKHQPCPKVAPEQQLDWDDSALTITINPMQNDNLSDESSESENSDSEDEEVINGRYKNVSQLEWDNSTI